jgi:hypothetical protein
MPSSESGRVKGQLRKWPMKATLQGALVLQGVGGAAVWVQEG